MWQLDISKQSLKIEGKRYNSVDFTGASAPDFASLSDFHLSLYLFLKEWFAPSPYLTVRTSGSSGTPKNMQVEKTRMMNSATLTCQYLDLKEDDTALLCMSLDYIAGKMMLVRALVASLDIYPVAPCGNPLMYTNIAFDFAAMIPMQVYNSIQNKNGNLSNIKKLIIGGSAIDSLLENELRHMPNKIYSTYGMTETLSHIALRQINGADASRYYTPLHAVELSLSDNNTLTIHAPQVAAKTIYTNDIAEMDDKGNFRIMGRTDNVINSGGIKIQVEEIEHLLRDLIPHPFAISSLPNSKLGEIVVLATTQHIDISLISNALPIYCCPKKIIEVNAIPLTETGKVARERLKQLILELTTNEANNTAL